MTAKGLLFFLLEASAWNVVTGTSAVCDRVGFPLVAQVDVVGSLFLRP
jgi:hypothetical protein